VSLDSAYCQWYSGINLHQGTFLFSSLQDISHERRLVESAAIAIIEQKSSASGSGAPTLPTP
jgi:hypothetical protein